jgi:hypothetical protein
MQEAKEPLALSLSNAQIQQDVYENMSVDHRSSRANGVVSLSPPQSTKMDFSFGCPAAVVVLVSRIVVLWVERNQKNAAPAAA